MADLGGAIGAGYTGFKAGSLLGGPVVGAIGAGIGALSGLFSDSPEEIARKRREELMKQNERYRQVAIARANLLKQGGIKDISKETSTQLGRAQSDVGRRAAALGRTGDAESMMLPVTSNINEAGGRNLETAIQKYDTGINDINTQYDQNAMGIQSDYASRPIQPSIADELMNVGSSIIQGGNYDKYLSALTSLNGGGGGVQNNPSMITPQKPDYSYLSNPSMYNRPYKFGGGY